MPDCKYFSSCFLLAEMKTDMPHTTLYLKQRYCNGGAYSECIRYKITKSYETDNVPTFIYRNDFTEHRDAF
jgi:hypothetical protein